MLSARWTRVFANRIVPIDAFRKSFRARPANRPILLPMRLVALLGQPHGEPAPRLMEDAPVMRFSLGLLGP
jgi:hypothetical protein